MNLSVLKDLKYAKKFQKNTIIDTHSTPALFIVLSGETGEFCDYRKQTQKLVRTYAKGEYFGESTFLFDVNTKNDFIALTEVIAIVVPRLQAVDFIHEEPGFAFELMKEFSGKHMGIKLEKHPAAASKQDVQKPLRAASATAKPVSATAQPAAAAHPADPVPVPQAAPKTAATVSQAAPKTAAPVPQAVQRTAVPVATLFPEGHKQYSLSMNNQDREHLLQKKCACPLCGNEFTMLHVREAKLVHLETDPDMRTHYKDIEPMYYSVVTCPACLYSAPEDLFSHPDRPGCKLPEGFENLAWPDLKFGTAMDTDSVFAGYYLALLCAPHCFIRCQPVQARLLYRLQQIYRDTGDTEMETQTAQKALDAYQYVYQNLDIPPNQEQQVCVLLGELYLKLGDLKAAREFFFKAKMNKQGAPLVQRHADDRIFDIKEMETNVK